MTCTGFALLFVHLNCTTPAAPPDTFCQIYKPVYWSRSDTRETKAQTDKNNRKYKALCMKGQTKNVR